MFLGMNEVKVMCDLAMISAGEDAVEVGRVSCLLGATMGFAPLIFWNDAKTQGEVVTRSRKRTMPGLTELLNRCKEVWKNVDKDEKILDEWVGNCFLFIPLSFWTSSTSLCCKFVSGFSTKTLAWNWKMHSTPLLKENSNLGCPSDKLTLLSASLF